MNSRSLRALFSRNADIATPERAATMPAIVGTVALDTPDAMERGLPDPEMAITSKTSIMPVTVPSRPSRGHRATQVLISAMFRSAFAEIWEMMRVLIWWACQDE